jgi:hypothetical protein
LLWIDFETLRAAPQRTLEQVLDFLDTRALNGADRARGIEQALSQVPIHPGTRAEAPVGEAVLKLEKLMSAAKQRFGDRGSIARRSVGR